MSMLAQAARGIKNIWSHGDDDYDSEEEYDGGDEASAPAQTSSAKYSDHKYSSSSYTPSYGGGGSTPARARGLRSVPIPLRAREKNIYTLRPKTLDEAAIAADYLKAGSAVVVNLESVARESAVRIIDFMSGVCYGLEGQGHAMKLGDSIFLFTPGEFEISSDELDYGENRDFFFKEIDAQDAAPSNATVANPTYNAPAGTPAQSAYTSSFASSYNTPQQHVAPQGGNVTTPTRPQASTPMQPQASAPAPRAQTLPASSFSASGQAHVTVGGRPAPTSVLTPAPRATNASRSWER
jgi:FtsZ-interacting cell division protein YlmF